jgi:hypothetical protein
MAERVGLAASRDTPLSCRQASAISAAMEAFARIMKNFGGAEAPEQLLPYLERKLAVSDQTGSVYRSVNRGVGQGCMWARAFKFVITSFEEDGCGEFLRVRV